MSRRQAATSKRRKIFYSASALLAMQTAVARAVLSVCLSVSPSVRRVKVYVQMNEDTIVRSSASGQSF